MARRLSKSNVIDVDTETGEPVLDTYTQRHLDEEIKRWAWPGFLKPAQKRIYARQYQKIRLSMKAELDAYNDSIKENPDQGGRIPLNKLPNTARRQFLELVRLSARARTLTKALSEDGYRFFTEYQDGKLAIWRPLTEEQRRIVEQRHAEKRQSIERRYTAILMELQTLVGDTARTNSEQDVLKIPQPLMDRYLKLATQKCLPAGGRPPTEASKETT